MFQLNLPFMGSKETIRRNKRKRFSARRKKQNLFGNKKIIPCIFCDQELDFNNATVEHIVPISKGGSNAANNLAISCAQCNNHRQSIDFIQWKRIAKFDKMVRSLIKLKRIVGRLFL